MTVSVVIPTFRRPDYLQRAIRSVVDNDLRPDEIIVAATNGDDATARCIKELQSDGSIGSTVRAVWVDEPGFIPPIEAGFQAAKGDIIATIDDDVTVPPHWLRALLAAFAEPTIGVVGGRVIVPGRPAPRLRGREGKLSWYGKHWGNVAWRTEPGDVSSVMECNWAWRRAAWERVRIDRALAQDDSSMYGLDLTLQARRAGYRIAFDPRADVEHHLGPRADGLDRADRSERAISYSTNYTYLMLKHLPRWRWPPFLAWWLLVGDRGSPGVLLGAFDLLTRPPTARVLLRAALSGKLRGIRRYARRRDTA